MAESQPPGEADANAAPASQESAAQAPPPDPVASATAPEASAPAADPGASGENVGDAFSIDELLNQASFEDPTKLTGAPGEDSATAAAEAAAAVAAAQA